MRGHQFSTSSLPSLQVKLTGTAPFSKVYIVKDGKRVHTGTQTAKVDFSWQDMAAEPGKMSYYYLRRAGERRNRVGIADVDYLYEINGSPP